MAQERVADLRRIRSTGDFPSSSNSRQQSLHADQYSHSGDPLDGTRLGTHQTSLKRAPHIFRPGSPPPIARADTEESLGSAAGPSNAVASPLPSIVVDHSPPQIADPPPEPIFPTASNTASTTTLSIHQHASSQSAFTRILSFFGYGRGASPERRSRVSLLWAFGWGFCQVVVIIVMLSIVSHTQSKTVPGLTEWEACNRPLGVWACLWIVRLAIACMLHYWGYQRDRITIGSSRTSDAESRPGNGATTQSNVQASSPGAPRPGHSAEPANLKYTLLFRRLTLFSSLFNISWFLTAQILAYTTINSCRLSSPRLWWLVFGILCLTYIIILEVIVLGFLVFILAPIIILFWNIFLMILGRHPIQNPTYIKPDIDKLPRSIVDKIPLVMYIPPPPDAPPSKEPIKIPENVYLYPPKVPVASTPSKRLFRFIRKSKKKAVEEEKVTLYEDATSLSPLKEKPETWEDHWEHGEYPFVVLEGNRAACAICLMDFEEPKRLFRESEESDLRATVETQNEDTATTDPPITEEARGDRLQLEDAGDGAQPLRLLSCGHVFHKTCLDPWLTDVSGRCPVCQRPVDVSDPQKKNKSQHH